MEAKPTKAYKAPDFESIRISIEFKGETYSNDFPQYETLAVSVYNVVYALVSIFFFILLTDVFRYRIKYHLSKFVSSMHILSYIFISLHLQVVYAWVRKEFLSKNILSTGAQLLLSVDASNPLPLKANTASMSVADFPSTELKCEEIVKVCMFYCFNHLSLYHPWL